MPEKALRGAIAAFLVGAVLIAAGVAVALAQAPPRLVRIGAPGVKALGPHGATLLGTTATEAAVCQSGEVLPAGVFAIRISIWAFYGAHVHVLAYQGSRLLTAGARGPNWTGTSVTVPVRPLAHSVSGVRVCFEIEPNGEPLQFLGSITPQAQAAENLGAASPAHPTPAGERAMPGRVVIEYLAPGRVSWLSRVTAVARHLGFGRFYSGNWIVFLLAALMAAAAALAVRLTLRELR
ncbi:MAG: hypothetical protein WAU69_12345 [Solirubrobacteraceae bacterium]